MDSNTIDQLNTIKNFTAAPVSEILANNETTQNFLSALDAQAKADTTIEANENGEKSSSRAFLLQYLDMISGSKGYVNENTVKTFQTMLGEVKTQYKAEIEKINAKGESAWFKVYCSARTKMQNTKTKRFTDITKLRRVVLSSIEKAMSSGAKGVKVVLSGRINGAEIGRREKFSEGKIPLSTIRSKIDYHECPSLTRSGYIGVKVYLCLS